MKIRTQREALVSLEVIAITDIILNMFIFFFTSFSRESRIQVKLPQADVRPQAAKREPIAVSIYVRGEVSLGSETSIPVIFKADKSVVFDKVVQVIEAVTKAGAEQLSIAVVQKEATSVSLP